MAEQQLVSVPTPLPFSAETQTRFALPLEALHFPFRINLSLAPLVAFWEQSLSGQASGRLWLDASIREALFLTEAESHTRGANCPRTQCVTRGV